MLGVHNLLATSCKNKNTVELEKPQCLYFAATRDDAWLHIQNTKICRICK